MSAQSYPTRAEANRANSQHSTGPRTEAGKAAVSTNATKHGPTANLQRLDPRDGSAYQQHLADLSTGLAPVNSTEQFLLRDLAMLKARLDRVEAAEYAALISTMESEQNQDEASAYLAAAPSLASLEKTERFLRRNYMQTWSRLERMQRERRKQEREAVENQPAEQAITEMPKQSQSQSTATKHEPDSTAIPLNTATAPPIRPLAFPETAAHTNR
jgi:hypothetical protein